MFHASLILSVSSGWSPGNAGVSLSPARVLDAQTGWPRLSVIFPQPSHSYAGLVAEIGLRPPPSASFPVHCSLGHCQ
jgi:hypothetical protein